jgi:hypothetical protein
MVNERHPTIEELRQWRRGGLEGAEVITIARHLAVCASCTEIAAARLDLGEAADALVDELVEPPAESAPFPVRQQIRFGALALAASLAIAFASVAWWMARAPLGIESNAPRTTPPVIHVEPVTATGGESESERLLAAIRRGARVRLPDVLRTLRSDGEAVRGGGDGGGKLSPAGIVLKSARPLFAWFAARGSQSVVRVFAGDRDVARSPSLKGTQWRPEHDLPRGVTYTWNVRVERGDSIEILPSAPAPVARFHIVDAGTAAKLEATEREHPANHLLLGVVYAEAGLVDEARSQLRLVRDPDDDAVARRLLQELEPHVLLR